MEITPKKLLQNAEMYEDEPALSVKDQEGNWHHTNWSDLYAEIMNISKALFACGVGINDKVSIYSYNRKEWYAGYLAAQTIGGVAVGVYHTCSSQEVEWIVGNSDSKVVFVGDNPMDNGEKEKMPNHRILKILDNLPQVETVVMMNGIEVLNHEKMISWEDFIDSGKF